MLATATRIGLRSVASMLAISALAFAIIASMPSDPVDIALRAWNLPATDETVAAMRSQWGLDQPVPARYGLWLSQFVAGDWGRSFRTGEPVIAEFFHRLPLSLAIGISGLALAALLAVPLGFAAALKPNGMADKASRLLSIGVQAVPSFWLGLLLIWLLGVQARLIRPFSGDASSWLLPIFLVALHALGTLSRVYRRDLVEFTYKPHFRTALAKGLSRRQALWRHGHRGAAYALLSAIRSEAGWAIGSTAALEILFGLPGISQFLVQSIAARDHMVLQAYVMVIACWMLLMNACLELAMRRLDPISA
ncbi:ABC transporter permease [Aminobacter sp. HY435]|uniref:ABC transporter permease n=1 Tax=Aminobacter sp. HY435 TaxID=2970917 RepID=UPI0022B9730F|nr:ABC transporter permease [Aminobacter sp. HY435]